MIGRTRWRFPQVDSTQNVAFALAQSGAPDGSVVRADFQTAGRGRQGRSWDAPVGSSLMFSVLLRPSVELSDLGSLSIGVGYALAKVFAAESGLQPQLKWPNDVLLNGKKVSGVLLQTRFGDDPVAVLGVGINVSTPSELLPESAISLEQAAGETPDTDDLASKVYAALDQLWQRWSPQITPDELTAIDTILWLRGEMVTLLDADREITGRILGIDRRGGLRLDIDGREKVIVAGEITRGPRPIE